MIIKFACSCEIPLLTSLAGGKRRVTGPMDGLPCKPSVFLDRGNGNSMVSHGEGSLIVESDIERGDDEHVPGQRTNETKATTHHTQPFCAERMKHLAKGGLSTVEPYSLMYHAVSKRGTCCSNSLNPASFVRSFRYTNLHHHRSLDTRSRASVWVRMVRRTGGSE